MSFEGLRKQSSAFLTIALNKSMSRQGSLRTVMASSTSAVQAAFWKMSRKTARDVSSISARLQCFLRCRCGEEGRGCCGEARIGNSLCSDGSD